MITPWRKLNLGGGCLCGEISDGKMIERRTCVTRVAVPPVTNKTWSLIEKASWRDGLYAGWWTAIASKTRSWFELPDITNSIYK
jgi:hypothetical protein